MALADLLKPNDPAALRKKLSIQLLDAQNALNSARDAWESAEADVLQDVGDPSTAARAHALVEKRRVEVEKIRAGISALDARSASASAHAAKAAREALWSKVDQAVTARTKAAQRMLKAVEDFNGAYSDIQDSTRSLCQSFAALDLKPAPDADALLLWPTHVEWFVRTELRRVGVEWAAPCVFGTDSLPEYRSRFEDTKKLAQELKGADRG